MLPGIHNERPESSLWPFRTANAVFHKQISEIKENEQIPSSPTILSIFSNFILIFL